MAQRLGPFGVGATARREAQRRADELWDAGVPARAFFKVEWGGWSVVVYDPPKTPGRGPRPTG
jgi:hypothetical protein